MRISDWSSDVCSSDLVKAITRADLEQLVEDLIKRTLDPCKKALKDAGLKADAIDEVVLVGGMTRMPKVRSIVKDFFGKEPHTGVNPDEVVARSEERRVGKECVSTGRSRWSRDHKKKKKIKQEADTKS